MEAPEATELLGAYSTEQLANYLSYNNFESVAKVVEQLQLDGQSLRNCCLKEKAQTENEVSVCELFGIEATEAARMYEELVKDFADVPYDAANPPDLPVALGVPIGGGGGGGGERGARGGETVGGALMREAPPDGFRNPRYPSWYDHSPTNDRWRHGFSRDYYFPPAEEDERERQLRERESKVEEREKRMEEIEARLKKLEEEKTSAVDSVTAPSA
jgi:hypothetical protein